MSDTIHPDTLAVLARHPSGVDATGTLYDCGCEHHTSTGTWWLCAYHQGYDDRSKVAAIEEALIKNEDAK